MPIALSVCLRLWPPELSWEALFCLFSLNCFGSLVAEHPPPRVLFLRDGSRCPGVNVLVPLHFSVELDARAVGGGEAGTGRGGRRCPAARSPPAAAGLPGRAPAPRAVCHCPSCFILALCLLEKSGKLSPSVCYL